MSEITNMSVKTMLDGTYEVVAYVSGHPHETSPQKEWIARVPTFRDGIDLTRFIAKTVGHSGPFLVSYSVEGGDQ